ncbi:adenylate kinase [Streptomyces sp. NPDC052013]|uniref:adenylate kinase n=1 Tax=Streptomyces sp. NPDC052013 TaxID=3365679 RepID=UPI0037D1064E
MRLLLIGPPGAGKGTQAGILSRILGVPHISTGDLFRDHVGRRTPLGREAARFLDAGELVPDRVTTDMVRHRLGEPDAERGFLLDGFPRTVPQARALSSVLAAGGTTLDAVVELTAPEDVLVDRLLARGRPDDTEDVVRHRQRIHHRQTVPVLGHYAGTVRSVEAVGTVEVVTARILTALGLPESVSTR